MRRVRSSRNRIFETSKEPMRKVRMISLTGVRPLTNSSTAISSLVS